jgi:choline dehydrogenase-like flavoprotein
MLIDAHSLSAGSSVACDLCIVGAGPAGIAIAERLRSSGLSVVILESGGLDLQVRTQNLYRGEVLGDPYFRLDACRWRVFGGGSVRWGGWCRPLEEVDFTRRGWIPNSGWPINTQNLIPFSADAARLLELPNAQFDLAAWRNRLPATLDFDGRDFENIVFQHSPETNFGEKYRADLSGAQDIRVILNANLTEMRLDRDSQRVVTLHVATLTKRQFTVRPRAVVLATGAIENARLLLASRADRPAGLGNEFDLVGRYFMDHLHVPVGHFLASSQGWNNAFYTKSIAEDARLRGVVAPTASAQARYRLLGTSISIEKPSFTAGTPFVGWHPTVTFGPVGIYRRLRDGQLHGLGEAFKSVAQRVHDAPGRIRHWNGARRALRLAHDDRGTGRIFPLYFRAEQAPDPTNRVTLSERRDALGVPESRLEWRIKSIDIESIEGWLRLLDRDVQARGLGRVIPPGEDWPSAIIGGPHHMGTTRMTANARHGVVDAECRVHSVDNLYVAGSSVFATGGYVNPTYSLVTLALRLADTLRARLSPTINA